jgi:hypothetical protein
MGDRVYLGFARFFDRSGGLLGEVAKHVIGFSHDVDGQISFLFA